MWTPDGDSTQRRIALSAIEHYAYCPRQAALIHVDGSWSDDVRTTLGDDAHRTVHTPIRPLPPPPTGTRRMTGVPVWSDRMAIYGICDVVEITLSGPAIAVEHKVGAYLPGGPADVQVAAQALCLNEMLDQHADVGYVYSHADRRRHPVDLTAALITRTEGVIVLLHALVSEQHIPKPVNDKRCRGCSLYDTCLPDLTATARTLAHSLTPQPLGNWDA
jgi:CRISPR-associated exonuclease Cas4